MKNIRHSSNNTTVMPPEDWEYRHPRMPLKPMMATGGLCEGINVLTTWWQPTPEEVAVILKGGLIQLACIGGMPPIKMEVVEQVGSVAVVPQH